MVSLVETEMVKELVRGSFVAAPTGVAAYKRRCLTGSDHRQELNLEVADREARCRTPREHVARVVNIGIDVAAIADDAVDPGVSEHRRKADPPPQPQPAR